MGIPQVVKDEVVISEWIKRITRRTFLDPDGKERSFLLWGSIAVPVIVFAITKNKKVIAIRQFRRAANKNIIEIPGGNPKNDESVEACGRRELLEETGFEAREIRQFPKPIWLDPCSCFIPFIPLLALDCKQVKGQELDASEKAENTKMLLFELPDWISMIHSGQICDSKTIVTTFLSLPHIR